MYCIRFYVYINMSIDMHIAYDHVYDSNDIIS